MLFDPKKEKVTSSQQLDTEGNFRLDSFGNLFCSLKKQEFRIVGLTLKNDEENETSEITFHLATERRGRLYFTGFRVEQNKEIKLVTVLHNKGQDKCITDWTYRDYSNYFKIYKALKKRNSAAKPQNEIKKLFNSK